jgi:hypothetical protein
MAFVHVLAFQASPRELFAPLRRTALGTAGPAAPRWYHFLIPMLRPLFFKDTSISCTGNGIVISSMVRHEIKHCLLRGMIQSPDEG